MGRLDFWVRVAIALGVLGSTASATEQPVYGPPPSWVKDVPVPTDVKPSSAAVDVLLVNDQQRLSPGTDEQFREVVARVNTAEGLGALGNLVNTWDPAIQTFAVHRLRILRDGRSIDLLANGKRFTIIRREAGLEAATIDGRLTATMQPEDLRVGDVLDFAVGFTTQEPAMKDHSEAAFTLAHPGVLHHVFVRASWPKSRAPKTFKTDDLPPLVTKDAGDRIEIGFEQTDAVSPEPPKGAPVFDSLFGLLIMSDFTDWQDVSRSMFPLFDKAATLSPASPLKDEIDRIAKAHPDPKGRALAALELVESDVRYLALMINAGGLTPAQAEVTWSRRYGDCKGKTALLLALLRGLGIEAVPALVSTTTGDMLDRTPPALAFDHVIVRATIAGKVYWLDGTRLGDESLDTLEVPNWHFALPLTREGTGLEPLVPRDPTLPLTETRMLVDLSAGLDKPAKVHREVTLRGDDALTAKLTLTAESQTDRDRSLRDMLRGDRNWVEPEKLDFTYDPLTMTFKGTLDGAGKPPFTSPGGGLKDWMPLDALVDVSTDLRRTGPYHKDAPYAVAYPAFSRDTVEVLLPDGGRRFSVANGGVVNQQAAGVFFSRAASLNDGRFTAVISRRAVRPRFLASEAESAESALKTLADYDVSIRFHGDSASVGPSAEEAGEDRTSADPETRGVMAFSAKHYAAADAAFSEAIKAAPSAKLYYDRAAARGELGRRAEAEADLKESLKLDPKHAFSLFALGKLAFDRGDLSQAQRLFEAAAETATPKGEMERRIASTYWQAKRFAASVPWWQRAVDDAAPGTPEHAANLGALCWNRAAARIDLERAKSICDAAVAELKGPGGYEERGYLRLRLGDFSGAKADYSEFIASKPTEAQAYYQRSLAERGMADLPKADADLSKARALNPKVEADAAEWGISP